MMIEVSGTELATALRAVSPHVSTDKTLPTLNAVKLRVVGMNLQVVATDRYTLAAYRLNAASDDHVVPHDFDALIPLDDVKRMMAALKSIPAYAPPVRLGVVDGWLTFESYGSVMRIRLETQQFPAYGSLLTAAIDAAKDNAGAPIDGESHAYNPKFLAKFEKATGKYDQLVVWPVKGGKSSTLVTVGSDFVGIIMQVRGEYSLPAWVDDTRVTEPLAEAVA